MSCAGRIRLGSIIEPGRRTHRKNKAKISPSDRRYEVSNSQAEEQHEMDCGVVLGKLIMHFAAERFWLFRGRLGVRISGE